jgi:microcystin degradation protein MlrC
VGLVRLPAWPSGRATAETFDWLREELIGALTAALPVDGVLLALHGAMAAEGHPDVEGEILQAVRAAVGDQVPVVATLDLHANVTPAMVAAADALVLYHTAPHVDVMNTGKRAANALRKILIDGRKPVTAFRKLPMVVPAERANTQDPDSFSYGIRKLLEGWERNHFVLGAGLATVQPRLDNPDLGSAALVVCTEQAPAGRADQS